jgi:hypothetical protein
MTAAPLAPAAPGPQRMLAAPGVLATAFAGLYAPTSFGGDIQAAIVPVYTIAICMLLVAMMGRRSTIWGNVQMAVLVLFMLAIFTVLSPLPKLAFGAVFPYLALCCVLSRDVRGVVFRRMKTSVLVVCLPVLLLAWSIVLGFDDIIAFQESWYQISNPDLFTSLVGWFAKPVSVFGTHSVAAFAYFAMSLLFLHMARCAASRADRVFAYAMFASFALLIPWLLSVSAILLFLGLLGLLGMRVLARLPWRLSTLMALLMVSFVAFQVATGAYDDNEMVQGAFDVLGAKGNGFAGRIGSESRLAPTYNYLADGWLQPVGITYDEIIEFGDNFIAEYVLRISIFGYLLVLLMLANFARTNLYTRSHCILLFLFFMAADLGYPLLTTFRVIFALPFFVVLWNTASAARREAAC